MARFLRSCPVLVLAVIAGACGPRPDAGPTPTLKPRPSPTTAPATPTDVPTQPATAEPGPTPTPFQHEVRSGETLLEIAALYGVSLDSLLALNPDVSPQLLSIGQKLLIPGPGGEPLTGLVPTPTPIPLGLEPPVCYRRPTAGVWCLAAVHNPSEAAVEGLVVGISLEPHGSESGPETAVLAPLNLLPPGAVMPVAAAFPEAVGEPTAAARIVSVLPAADLESRYRRPRLRQTAEQRQPGGASWLVEGELTLPDDTPSPNRTALLVIALDDRDRVVGYAVWEPTTTLLGGETAGFRVRVFSLGPPIARISLVAESFALAARKPGP